MRARIFVAGAFCFLPACGAILDLPDPTVRDDFNAADGASSDGGSNDGQIFADGEQPDGSTPKDGSVGADGSLPDSGPHSTCGDAGKDCFGGDCVNDKCLPIALTASVNDPREIVYSNNKVYVISGLQMIYAVDNFGAKTPITASEPNLTSIAVSGGQVYFSSQGSGMAGNTDGNVSSCPITGCDGTRKNYVVGSKREVNGVAADGTNVYYGVDDATGTNGGGIYTCTLGTTPCSQTTPTLSKADVTDLVLGGTSLFFLSGISTEGPFHCTASSCTTSGGADNFSVVDYAIGTTYTFYATASSINYETLSGATQMLLGSQTNNVAIGTDDTYVYWISNGGTNAVLNRCTVVDMCAGGAEPIAIGLDQPFDLAVSSDSIYFTTVADHKIWRLAK